MRMSFLKSPWCQILLMFCVVVAELVMLDVVSGAICDYCKSRRIISLALLALTVTTLVIFISLGFISGQFRLPSTRIIHRFIDNSLDGDKIILIALLFFVIHFTWFVDMAFEVVLKHNADYLGMLAVIGIAWFCTLLFFPYSDNIDKSDSGRKVIFTPLSGRDLITWENLDLLLKPLLVNVQPTDLPEGSSIKLDTIETVVILPSDSRNAKTMVKKLADLRSNADVKLCSAITQLLQEADKVNAIDELISGFNADVVTFGETADWDKSFCSILHDIVNIICEREINFIVVQRANYNDFKSFKDVAVAALKNHENHPNEVYLYVSPGTAVPSAALSILSVVGGRRILYADQSSPDVVKSIFIDKNTVDGWFKTIQNEDLTVGKTGD